MMFILVVLILKIRLMTVTRANAGIIQAQLNDNIMSHDFIYVGRSVTVRKLHLVDILTLVKTQLSPKQNQTAAEDIQTQTVVDNSTTTHLGSLSTLFCKSSSSNG